MKLKSRYYTYPVLSAATGAYTSSSFNSDAECCLDGYNVKFTLKVELKNAELEAMLQQGVVEIIHHIECSQTCYRQIVRTKDYSKVFPVRDSEINGEVQICTFLVAVDNIDKYSNSDFSEDYRGFSFKIDKGAMLAIGNQISLTVNKMRDDLANKSSIFSIVLNTEEAETELKVNLGGEKIAVLLPKNSFNSYSNKQADVGYQSFLHAMVLLPALMFTLSTLKEDRQHLYDYEDRRWFKNLRKACEKIDMSFDETALGNMDIFVVAQKLLAGPTTRSLESVVD